MWKVMCGKKFIGIIETNFEYASKYWQDYSRDWRRNPEGRQFHLEKIVE